MLILQLRSGETESIIVNGQSYPASFDGVSAQSSAPYYTTYADRSTTCGPEVFVVEPNKTYRFRTIGGTALSTIAYGFEHHDNLTVIAADARYTQPAYTDRIQVGAGQRFDYLLQTKTVEELKHLNMTIRGKDNRVLIPQEKPCVWYAYRHCLSGTSRSSMHIKERERCRNGGRPR